MSLNKKNRKKHKFHFVISEDIRQKIQNLEVFEEPMGFSKTVGEILSELSPVIKVEHEWGEQRMSKYKYVSDDPDEPREHVCVYLDEDVYRELKLIHHDLNFYSLAQIVRGVCEFFLELVDEFGNDVFKVLAMNYEQWEENARDRRLPLQEEVALLLQIIPLLPGKRGLLTIYDRHFAPFYRLRL
jgi:hypothetical protein